VNWTRSVQNRYRQMSWSSAVGTASRLWGGRSVIRMPATAEISHFDSMSRPDLRFSKHPIQGVPPFFPGAWRRPLAYIYCLGPRMSGVMPQTSPFLDAFAKLRKATTRFVMFVCPCGTSQLLLDGLS